MTAASAALVAAALLSVAWTALQPPFSQNYAERLAAIDEAGASATVSASLFALSQLPMLAGLLGVAHLIRRGAPILSNLGGSLAVVGVFGHSVFGGFALAQVAMAGDQANRELYAALVEQIESSPFMAFAAAGLIGTVLGMLLLGVGLWRSRVVPRWVPMLWWLFLLVEFVGTSLSDYAAYVSSVCLLVVFGALAAAVWRSPREEWAIASEPPAPKVDGSDVVVPA